MGSRGASVGSKTELAALEKTARQQMADFRQKGTEWQIAKANIQSASSESLKAQFTEEARRLRKERSRAREAYFETQAKINELKRGKLATTTAQSSKETPVNSYGERATRNITSGTYERAQRRQQRDIDNWFRR